jgi:hypothetical protein
MFSATSEVLIDAKDVEVESGKVRASAGPKMLHIMSAALTAASSLANPPSVYVAPPIDRRIVLLYFS